MFPLGMPGFFSDGGATQNMLGLGINSTVLNALQAAGKIASRSYSYWWGQMGAPENVQMDGSIVFGGYDMAKVSGTPYTKSLINPEVNCGSGMRVTISDLILGFPNGTQGSILGHKQIFACLTPDFPVLMTMPEDPYYRIFEGLTGTNNIGIGGGYGIDAPGALYPPDEVYEGSLTIELDSAFSVEVPNNLLVKAPKVNEDDGTISTNTSVREVVIFPAPGEDGETFILGRPFFSAAYLSVDYDAETFSLWKAHATEHADVVPFGDNCSMSPDDADPFDKVPPKSKENNKEPLSSRTIAVTATCSVLVVVITLAAVAFLWYIRRRKRRITASSYGNREASETSPSADSIKSGTPFEIMTSSEIQEMSTDKDPHELAVPEDPTELSTERASRVRQMRQLQGQNAPVELA
ncbi:hypothetical protein LTR37_019846 [Vermiconidia calcicola]|uniref:Uncharacterized protein n=1 Tax=Vermiconidia calcicola TaxID=1690605 RepID=A0ACC3MCX6_9PEZI|nr:hypothetical protein LTR37_019846 [Vermiconidia calcicola]